MKEQMKKAEEKMQKTLAALDKEFTAIRAGRANPAVLDKVAVDYYGVPTPINQMAAISVPEARTLVIQPWDLSTLKSIEKAILASDLGFNPNNDGKVLRIVFPPLTEERRRDLAKDIRKYGEESKGSPQHPPGSDGETQSHEERRRADRRRPEGRREGSPEAHR